MKATLAATCFAWAALLAPAAAFAEAPYLVEWTRQIGTSSDDISISGTVDSAGNAYITGYTSGSLKGTNTGLADAFLTKFDSSGSELWTQQIGTSSIDRSDSVVVDSAGNIYISGVTWGSLEGTIAGRYDAFITKFDSSGGELWTQQIGTSGDDSSSSVAVDSAGDVYISGTTSGSLEGTNAGVNDAFITKFDSSGSELWTQQIGTSSIDYSSSVAVDSAGNAYISGVTWGSLEGTNTGLTDAFLTKFDSSGSELWTQQIGTSRFENGTSVAVDIAGNAYIASSTYGSLEGTNAGLYDAFITKFDSSGSELWTQQIGTANHDLSSSVALDGAGNAYISGSTRGSLKGTNAGQRDAFLIKFDGSGSELWTQQIGTSSDDVSTSISVDSAGNAYITGYTSGSLEGTNAGLYDAFLVKFTVPEPRTLLLGTLAIAGLITSRRRQK